MTNNDIDDVFNSMEHRLNKIFNWKLDHLNDMSGRIEWNNANIKQIIIIFLINLLFVERFNRRYLVKKL